MGNNSEPHNEPLATTTNLWRDGVPPSHRPSSEYSRADPTAPPFHSASTSVKDFAVTSVSSGEPIRDSPSTSPVPVQEDASGEEPAQSEHTNNLFNDDRVSWAIEEPAEFGEPSVLRDKGKKRVARLAEPVEPKPSTSHFATQQSDGLLRTALTNASESHTSLLPPSQTDTTEETSDKPCCGIKNHPENHPAIIGPRAIQRRGMPRYRQACSIPLPRNMYDHRSITVYAGERLFRLCRSVPYILGPLMLVKRLQLIIETPLLLPQELKELIVRNGLDVASLTAYDLALLHILGSLIGLRTRISKEPYTDQRLEIYLLKNNGESHRCHCNILEFMDHMRRWRESPNPPRILNEDRGQITWKHVVRRLGQLGIDVNKLDLALYEELRACDTYNALTTKLLEIQKLQRTGALEDRSKKWKREGIKKYDEMLRAEAKTKFTVGLNNKRFSHQYPRGIDVNELGEILATHALLRIHVEPKPKEQVDQKQLEEQAEPKMLWRSGVDVVKGWLWYPAWRYIIVSTIVMGGLVGGFTYFQLQHKVCGNECLGNAPA